MRNWRDITYLTRGDAVQRKVHASLLNSHVLESLNGFDPILTGTYPIGIYLPKSDLDIACCYQNKDAFVNLLQEKFSVQLHFSINEKQKRGIESIIGRFEYNDFLFEIFGQAIPVKEQYSYRHMLIEYELLKENDETFRENIITLKKKGLSTEEAFAELLDIEGDPYKGLLRYE